MGSKFTLPLYSIGSITLIFAASFTTINNNKPTINLRLADTTKGNVFSQVEKQPEFPGGFQAFGAFIGANVHYPADDAKNKIEGRAFCTFIIEKNGKLSNIQVLRAPSEAMGKEAARVLSRSPAWKPGYQNGGPVRVAYTVPINFSLKK